MTDSPSLQPHPDAASPVATPSELLRASESRYRRLFETALDGILLLNAATGQIEDVNPYLMRMLGYTHAEFLGKKIWEVGAFADIAENKSLFAELQDKGSVRYEDLPLVTRGGKLIEVEFVSNSYDCEGVLVIQCNIRDVTDRKLAESSLRSLREGLETRIVERTRELESAVRELEAFSYSVAHDLRSPLRAINGFSAILLETEGGSLGPGSLEYLKRIRKAGDRMAELIDDLLSLAQISRHALKASVIDLSELAGAAVAAQVLANPSRSVRVSIQPGIRVNCDPHLMRIVMDNLMENAFKFTGHIAEPHIEFGEESLAGERVFFVRDNGAGFDMRYTEKMFGAFERLHDREEFPGTGIGLNIVQRIVQRHGGRVFAEGVVGKGATLRFTVGVVR